MCPCCELDLKVASWKCGELIAWRIRPFNSRPFRSSALSFPGAKRLVIESILILNLVRARSSWLGLGTIPNRLQIGRRIAAALYECAAAHTVP